MKNKKLKKQIEGLLNEVEAKNQEIKSLQRSLWQSPAKKGDIFRIKQDNGYFVSEVSKDGGQTFHSFGLPTKIDEIMMKPYPVWMNVSPKNTSFFDPSK